MQLNEILEEHSLESISERTRISPQNLEALIHGEWGRLRKVQALGFLSILEREYGVDLSQMREECRAYFESHAPGDKAISLTAEEVTHTGKHRFAKVLTLLILLGLAYGSWYLFVEKNKTLESNSTATSKESFYDSVIDMAGGWFKGDEANSTERKASAPKELIQGVWAQEKNESEKGEKEESPEEEKTTRKGQEKESLTEPKRKTAAFREEKNNTTVGGKAPSEEEKIIAQVKAEQAQKEENKAAKMQARSPEEKKAQAEREISSMISEATEGQKKNTQESAAGDALESIPPSMKHMTASNAVSHPSTEVPTAESKASAPEAKKETAKNRVAGKTKEKKVPAGGIVIFHPRSKVWVGYTELRSMKRFAKVTDREIPFDTSKGDYILAVGHGMVQFRGPRGELLKLNDGGKHFFMIAKGGVREISHEAFQRLNKNKVW